MQVTNRVVAAAAIAFLVLFAAVFFLLGRESAHRRVMAAAAPPAALEVGAPPPPAPRTTRDPFAEPSPHDPAPVAPPSAPPAVAAPPSAAPGTLAPSRLAAALPPIGAAPAANPEAAAARDYFTRMEAIQTVGPTSDTGEFANKLLAAAMHGDMSGFDELAQVAQAGAARAQAIAPPACCVEYHQQLIAMLTESVAMVQHLKAAIASNDAAALTGLAASGSSLQAAPARWTTRRARSRRGSASLAEPARVRAPSLACVPRASRAPAEGS